MNYNQQNYNNQCHVHEITGSTRNVRECNDCHNHRFCTVSDEARYNRDRSDHYHEVKFRTDTSDGHYHEFYTKTSCAINVGNGKHVHFINDITEEANGHKHELQCATLIDSPTDFNYR